MLSKLSAPRAALVLAALAIPSALMTNFFVYVPGTDDFPKLAGAPLLPGIYFGLVLAIGVLLWGKAGALEFLAVLVGTIVAWILAFRTALSVHDFVNGLHAGAIGAGSRKLPAFAIAGVVAGLVGSLGSAVAVAIASAGFRAHSDWLRTIALGTVAGALLYFGDEPYGTFLPLFVVWQMTVAASVAYGLAGSRPKRKR